MPQFLKANEEQTNLNLDWSPEKFEGSNEAEQKLRDQITEECGQVSNRMEALI